MNQCRVEAGVIIMIIIILIIIIIILIIILIIIILMMTVIMIINSSKNINFKSKRLIWSTNRKFSRNVSYI